MKKSTFPPDHINRDIVNDKWQNIIDFIRDFINRGFYIYALFDVSKILLYESQKPWYHDPLIYGYDDEKQLIYFADNYKNGKYSTGSSSYREMIEATSNYDNAIITGSTIDFLKGYYCIKYKTLYDYGNCRFSNNFVYHFDKILFFDLIADYLYQKNSFRRWSSPQNLVDDEADKKNVWGIGIYSFLLDYLDYVLEQNIEIDIRSFYVLIEHKQLIKKVLVFLLGERKNMVCFQEYLYSCDECISLSKAISSLSLRYNILHDQSIMIKIKKRLSELQQIEEKFLGNLLVNNKKF